MVYCAHRYCISFSPYDIFLLLFAHCILHIMKVGNFPILPEENIVFNFLCAILGINIMFP